MKVVDIQNKIKDKAWKFFKSSFYNYRLTSTPILQNINFSPLHNQKRVIICYLTSGLLFDLENASKGRTQPFEIHSIINTFSELGFCIDIIGYNDIKAIEYVKNKKYDIVFGFGEAFFHLTNY